MDDWKLLQEYVQSGSRAALDELVRRYVGMVHAAAWRQVGDAPKETVSLDLRRLENKEVVHMPNVAMTAENRRAILESNNQDIPEP